MYCNKMDAHCASCGATDVGTKAITWGCGTITIGHVTVCCGDVIVDADECDCDHD